MSATSYRAADLPTAAAEQLVGDRGERSAVLSRGAAVDVLLFLFCASMLYLMDAQAGQETIPYHFLFLSVTIVYGFRVWPLVPTIVVVVAVTTSTGLIMVAHQRAGHIDGSELWEVPLMPALLTAMVWHARRRAVAQAQVQRMADQRRASLEREREFFRDTSHAIRTPVTIARGHLELIEPTLDTELAREDLLVALRQLDRMSNLSSRLLAIAQLDAGMALRTARVDLGDFIGDVGPELALERRSGVVGRHRRLDRRLRGSRVARPRRRRRRRERRPVHESRRPHRLRLLVDEDGVHDRRRRTPGLASGPTTCRTCSSASGTAARRQATSAAVSDSR